jgi:signal transduction histidine kinase
VRLRVFLALLVTSAVTLGIAALALLSPLRDRLEDQSITSLRTAMITDRPQFEAALRPREASSRLFALQERANAFRRRTDARVVVFTERPRILYDTDNGEEERLPLLATLRALRTQQIAELRAGDQVTIAMRLFGPDGTARGTFVAERRLTDVVETVEGVQRAFLAAAAVGLAVALALGAALSATLSRRLARLRAAALRITEEGPDAPAPRDRRGDEIGDLSRALAGMQASLHRQEEARRAFVATASHELRTPLTMLQGTLELLEEDLREGHLDAADAREQVAGAQRELRRLARLATELLDLSRLDADVPLRTEPVELGELARAVAAEFSLAAADAGVHLAVVPPPGPCWAGGDPGAVARVVRILLENALRFAPPGEPLTVTAAYRGERAIIEVADRGPGVPPADRERIFRRFERGADTSGEGGFGLGLAIGRELAHRMGGELTLERAGPPGATFRLALPIELPAGSRGEPQGPHAPHRTAF